MNNIINLDFLKLSDTGQNKTGKSKNIPSILDSKKPNLQESTFKITESLDTVENTDNLRNEALGQELEKKKNKKEELIVSENFISNIVTDTENKDSDLKKKHLNVNYSKRNPELEIQKDNSNNKVNNISDIKKQNNLELSEKSLNTDNKNILYPNKAEKTKVSNENRLTNIFSSIKGENKKKFTSFFKNYINFTSKKNIKNKSRIMQVISSNQLGINEKINNDINAFKIKTNGSELEKLKETNIIKNDTVPLIKKYEINSNFKDTNNALINKEENNEIRSQNFETLNNFDRLRNILDIRSSDVSTRMAEIFERNIKLGNTKFEVQIKPESLGKIEITLEIQGDNLDINMRTDNNQTIHILSENSNNLQKMLQSQGLTLNNFNLNNNNNRQNNSKNNNNESKKVSETELENENNNKTNKSKNTGNLVYIKA